MQINYVLCELWSRGWSSRGGEGGSSGSVGRQLHHLAKRPACLADICHFVILRYHQELQPCCACDSPPGAALFTQQSHTV